MKNNNHWKSNRPIVSPKESQIISASKIITWKVFFKGACVSLGKSGLPWQSNQMLIWFERITQIK